MATSIPKLRMIGLTVIFLALLFPILFAWWSENIDIWVIDPKGRSIPNANVTIVYQTTACNKHTSLTKTTDVSGRVHFDIMNMVEEGGVPECVEKSYPMTATYGGVSNTTIGVVKSETEYLVMLPLVRYTARVVGMQNNTLVPSYAIFAGNRYTSDSKGVVSVFVPATRSSNVDIGFGNVTKAVKVDSSSDREETVVLPVYILEIRLFDENEKRINGTINAGGVISVATDTEAAVFNNFPYSSINATVFSGGEQREVSIIVTSPQLDVYVDFSPPTIREVTATTTSKGNAQISAAVAEDGKHASGLASNPIVRYKLANTTAWAESKMFPTATKKFEATVLVSNTDFEYEILAFDNQGNEKKYVSSFSFEKKGDTKGDTGFKAPSIDVTHLVAIAIFVFVVFLVYRKIRESV